MSKRLYDLEWVDIYGGLLDTENSEEILKEIQEFKKKDQRIAELEKQLKNCIRPKFKIGQEVWTEWKGDIVEREIKSLYWDVNEVVEYRLKGGMYVISRWEDEIFATKEEAQAKLKELQGE